MKTFSLGFILASIRIAYLHNWHLNSIKVFFDNIIVILPSYLIIIFITWSSILSLYKHINHRLMKYGIVGICKFVAKFYKCFKSYKLVYAILNKCIKEKKKVFNSKLKAKKLNWQCLLIDGAWGSGKTTHYETYYKYIDANPNIYISCFSASRSELIAQIIQQRLLYKLLTLNGILARFMENNWQIFMPKNRVVVFDDLERLHASKDNYLDLIGVIDYLKNKMECKIILICNMSELKEPIFNSYMERIVDETEFPTLMSKNEFRDNLIKEPNELTKKLLDRLYQDYASDKINNLRIIKNIMPKVAKKLDTDYLRFNEDEQVLNGSYSEIIELINKHYLFYIDNALFKECSNMNNGKILYNHTQDDRDKYYADLQAKLNPFNLKCEDFKCSEYRSFRDIQKILDLNLNDYLRQDILISLDAKKEDEVRHKANEYLSKFISQQTCNIFNLDYVLYLLFVVCTAKVDKCQDYFDEILSNAEFMNQSTFKPIRDIISYSKPLFPVFNEKEFELFNPNITIDGSVLEFEKEYRLFYRNKVINKFIESKNQVLWDQVNLFADTWFISDHAKESQLILFDGEASGDAVIGVRELYTKSNRYLNLNTIQQWIDKKVEPNTLLEYYTKVLEEFEIEKQISKNNIYFFDWLLSDEVNSYPKVKEKFAVIRKKFTKLNEMIKNYVYNIENYSTQYDLLVQKYIDLINKLETKESK